MLEQLATAWRERNLVTEEHWSTAAGDLKKKRDQLNRLVSALHRRRANGMTAYEAFGRVVADRDRLADIGLTWPAGTVHSPEHLARMRETCADIRTALEAVGDPAVHPLQGIEQTSWNPAWVQTLQQTIDRLQVALQQMRIAADALVASLGLNEIADDSLLPQLVKLVALMLNADAADGVLLLNDEAPERIRALRRWPIWSGRINEKTSELVDPLRSQGRATRPSGPAARMDGSLRLERAGAQWSQEEGPPSSEALLHGRSARRDRPRPRRATGPRRPVARTRSPQAAISRAWNGCGEGLNTDPSRIAALIKWAGDVQAAVDAFQIDGVPSGDICSPTSLAFSPTTSHAFVPVARCGGPSRPCIRPSRRCTRRPRSSAPASVSIDPRRLSSLEPGWIEALLEQTARWKANVDQGPAMGDLARSGEERRVMRVFRRWSMPSRAAPSPVTRSPVRSILPTRGGWPRPSSTTTRY